MLLHMQVAVNVTGHCAYELPMWLHALVTAGVGCTPFAATSRFHYIHHLDPRVNRGLYFTWWDRTADTYTDEHPMCIPPTGQGDVPIYKWFQKRVFEGAASARMVLRM